MSPIVEKLKALRKYMSAQNIAAIIIPSNDPHFSEYVADRWKTREWISGFTGSAGTVVITTNNAALWTDSRYFIQAEKELQNSGIELKKLRIEGTESIEDWLKQQLTARSKIAIDKDLYSIAEFESLKKSLTPLCLVPIDDPFDEIWNSRPGLPSEKAFLITDDITGESVSSKLSRLREILNQQNESYIYPVTLLDEIAWLCNIRGNDISYNPLVLTYALVTPKHAYLFINTDKLTHEDKATLEEQGITIHGYDDIDKIVKHHQKERFCIFNPKKTAVGTFRILEEAGFDLINENDPNGTITSLKSIKNEVEQEGFRKAMVDDGVALVRFQRWLEQEIKSGNVTELSAANCLFEFRKQNDNFIDNSFSSIMGYKEHGAIVHYAATPESDITIKPEGFLLFDTGGQYRYGTTDVTRTIHLSEPNEQEKEDYTLVLKGMIALSMAKFPAGTRGVQLDVLARQYLWSKGKNYMHGTGHGIGHFLNVHEGPQSIRMEENPVVLKPGMITSNEPGLYIEGKYGIRIENLTLCKQEQLEATSSFMGFETLTLAPIDLKPIDISMLIPAEIDWLNRYHKMVFERISPRLNSDEIEWLKEKTKAI
jgi:Xaa-Pro aminopeptidase